MYSILRSQKFEWFGPAPIEPFNSGRTRSTSASRTACSSYRRPPRAWPRPRRTWLPTRLSTCAYTLPETLRQCVYEVNNETDKIPQQIFYCSLRNPVTRATSQKQFFAKIKLKDTTITVTLFSKELLFLFSSSDYFHQT